MFCSVVMGWRTLFLIQHRCRCAKWILYGQRWSGTTIEWERCRGWLVWQKSFSNKLICTVEIPVNERSHDIRYKIDIDIWTWIGNEPTWIQTQYFIVRFATEADDPFFNVSACANSVCQIDFVVAENYRCRTMSAVHMEHVCICCALHTLHYYCSLYFMWHVDVFFASSILGFTPNFRWKWQFCVCTDVNAKLCTNIVFCML